MTDSQDWWLADWGSYVGMFARVTWHGAGSIAWPTGAAAAWHRQPAFRAAEQLADNANTDKAAGCCGRSRRNTATRFPGPTLILLAGTVAYEVAGLKTFGFAFGREDIWHPEKDTLLGRGKEWLALDGRYSTSWPSPGTMENPLAAVQMGLIYVNPGA